MFCLLGKDINSRASTLNSGSLARSPSSGMGLRQSIALLRQECLGLGFEHLD